VSTFDPPTSSDSQSYDRSQDADRVEIVAGSVSISGSVAVSNFPAVQPVSGSVAATQGTTPWVVDGSAVTQPVSAASLPLPAGAATDASVQLTTRAIRDATFDAWLRAEDALWS